MKKMIKTILSLVLLCLIISNVYIFVAGIKSSDQISKMESELVFLKKENIELETRLGQVGSLEFAASMAAKMDFTKKAGPAYLDSLRYAMNR